MRVKFLIYIDSKGKHRWRLKASNGKIVADSAEGYNTEKKLLQSLERLKIAVANAKIVNTISG